MARGYHQEARETYERLSLVDKVEDLLRKDKPVPVDLMAQLSEYGISMEDIERRI